MRFFYLLFLASLLGALPLAPSLADGGGGVKQPARSARQQQAQDLTAAQLTGTYEAGQWGTLDVAAQPGEVRVHLVTLVGLNRRSGPNIGEVDTVLLLDPNMAVYAPPENEGKGRLIFRFAPGHVDITQIGASWDVGFGMGVNAGGRYKKTSSKNPHLGPAPKQDSGN